MAEDKTKKPKMCVCVDPGYPDALPSPPTEYHGTGKCSKCKGVIKFPVPKKEYQPSEDETLVIEAELSLQGIRKFLKQALIRNSFNLENDLVPAVLLLDIAKSLGVIAERLTALTESKKDSKRK